MDRASARVCSGRQGRAAAYALAAGMAPEATEATSLLRGDSAVLPWFLPGVAVSVAVSLAVGGRVGRALGARRADFFGAVYDTQRQAIVVADRDGRVLLASRELMVPPDLLMGFAREPGRAPQVVEWKQHGDDWCAVLAWGTLGQRSIATAAATPVVLVVALNRSSTNLMLDHVVRRLKTHAAARLRSLTALQDRFGAFRN